MSSPPSPPPPPPPPQRKRSASSTEGIYYHTSSKKRKVYVEIPRLRLRLQRLTPKTSVAASGSTPPGITYDTTFWDVKRGRGRSLSVDSTCESDSDRLDAYSEGMESISPSGKRFDAVEITPHSNKTDPRYQPGYNETMETATVVIPGEASESDSSTNLDGVPVRFLTDFTFYDSQKRLISFDEVISRLSSSKTGAILASGLVTSCSVTGQPPPSVGQDLPPLLSLSEVVDYWTDYTTRDLTGLWHIRVLAVKTKFAWYILQIPAVIYASKYQLFWVAHFVTWRAIHAMRQKSDITRHEFFIYLKKANDSDFLDIMGREVMEYDLCQSFVATYLLEQLTIKNLILKSMQQLPLIQDFIRQEITLKGRMLTNENDTRTVTTPRVFSLAQKLFHPLLFVDGERRLPAPRNFTNPGILHPDNPSNISWRSSIPDRPGFYSSISIDGNVYKIGDCIMVKPGEDELTHRALNAKQRHSLSHENEMGNRVWFCKIRYIFKPPSDSKTEPFVHVQWFEHSSKTLLQEIAHPLELFALYDCDDIPIDAILGPVNVLHPDPTNLDPEGYYCRFIWDFENSRFLQYSPSLDPTHSCESCDHQERFGCNDTREYSSRMVIVKDIEYHIDDYVYITRNTSRLYTIGQLLNFSKPDSSGQSKVQVSLFGRFDDVARLEGNSDQRYDEKRLFQTEEKIWLSPENLEGKCWIANFDEIGGEYGYETFYVDRWAPTRKCIKLSELQALKGKIRQCAICVDNIRRKRDEFRTYKRDNVPLRMMELFAGAGGLSTGLEQTGYIKSYWAVELSPSAAATFQANHDDSIVYNEDTNICLQSALDEASGKRGLGLKTVKDGTRLMPKPGEVDFIAGGFPCQSFSGMNHQRKYSDDDIRTTLVVNMLSYVDFYRPRFVLMENVKGLLQHHSKISHFRASKDIIDTLDEVKMSIVKFILRALLHMSYQVQFRLLEAADYGSPQRRERIIFMAARCTEVLPPFPFPTHVTESHRGQILTLPTGDKLRPVERSEKQCAPYRALTVADAISDLPEFAWIHPGCAFGDEQMSPEYKVFSAVSSPDHTLVGFPAPVTYRTEPLTRYQQNMRTSEPTVTLHCSRTFQMAVVERVWHICSNKHPRPTDLPQQFWTAALRTAVQNAPQFDKVWKTRFACRLQWEKAFNTALTTCRPFSKGTSVLHPTQRRIITARECARSQGFPDDYHFVQVKAEERPKDWSKLLDDIHKQIGNAVPVPLARALGRSIGAALVEGWLLKRKP